MRTTIRLEPDVAAAAENLRREKNIGLGDAVNELARAGMRVRRPANQFTQRSVDLGLTVDVSNIADVLELLDAADSDA